MKTYNIYKKRDGQDFRLWGEIYASNFKEAKKKFAENMTNDNWNLSNNVIWLDKEEGVKDTGWYDLNGSVIIEKLDPDNKEGDNYTVPDYKNSKMELFCSEKSINKGFDSWCEDVYTWQLRKH